MTTGGASVTLPVGDVWHIVASVRDADGTLTDTAPVVTVTDPAGTVTTPAVERIDLGTYRSTVTVALAGRYIAAAANAYGTALYTAWAAMPVAAAGMPDRDALDDYLGEHSYTDAELDDALTAEAAAQRAVCRIPAVYDADLANALLRRAQRNLYMRRLPVALPQGDAEAGAQVLPRNDPEVRRLEAPYRKRVMG